MRFLGIVALNSLCDELKTYCHALDFYDAIAPNKLWRVLEEARCCNAMEMAKLAALWERLNYSKQNGRPVDLCATMFASLATEAELEADKIVWRYECMARQNQTRGSPGPWREMAVEEVPRPMLFLRRSRTPRPLTAPKVSHVTNPKNLELNKPCHFQAQTRLSFLCTIYFYPMSGPRYGGFFRLARPLHPGSQITVW